MGNNLLEFLSY